MLILSSFASPINPQVLITQISPFGSSESCTQCHPTASSCRITRSASTKFFEHPSVIKSISPLCIFLSSLRSSGMSPLAAGRSLLKTCTWCRFCLNNSVRIVSLSARNYTRCRYFCPSAACNSILVADVLHLIFQRLYIQE